MSPSLALSLVLRYITIYIHIYSHLILCLHAGVPPGTLVANQGGDWLGNTVPVLARVKHNLNSATDLN